MTNIKTKIGAGLAAAAMMGSVIAPSAFADTSIVIRGNGNNSDNGVSISTKNKSSVYQGNYTSVFNGIHVDQNTGDNSVKENTGNNNNNSIRTGDTTSRINIEVEGNSNSYVSDCGCEEPENLDVVVRNNGNNSENKVRIRNKNRKSFDQYNESYVTSFIGVDQNTGDNSVKENTGKRNRNRIRTGNTSSNISIWVGGSTNSN